MGSITRANLGTQDEMPRTLEDQQLMARIAHGDQFAFSLLYDRLSGPLYSLALKMLGDASEAEDALQEVCLQIWRRAFRLRSKTKQLVQLGRDALCIGSRGL